MDAVPFLLLVLLAVLFLSAWVASRHSRLWRLLLWIGALSPLPAAVLLSEGGPRREGGATALLHLARPLASRFATRFALVAFGLVLVWGTTFLLTRSLGGSHPRLRGRSRLVGAATFGLWLGALVAVFNLSPWIRGEHGDLTGERSLFAREAPVTGGVAVIHPGTEGETPFLPGIEKGNRIRCGGAIPLTHDIDVSHPPGAEPPNLLGSRRDANRFWRIGWAGATGRSGSRAELRGGQTGGRIPPEPI